MKKVLAFLLTVILVASASICVAFAAPSVEAQGIISGITAIDADENEANITVEKIDGKVSKEFYAILKGLKDETKDKTLKVVGHFDVGTEGDVEYPVTITLDVLGISKSSEVYVLVQSGKDVVSITPTVKAGKIVFELDEEIDKFAIVTDGKTANKVEKENDVLAPQTSDAGIYVLFAAIVAMAVMVISYKKVRA